MIEERRKAIEGILWQLPSLSLAVQAFLLTAGLNPDAEPWAQIVVGTLGILAVLATGFVVLYQALRATTLGHWVEHNVTKSLAPQALGKDGIGLNKCQERMLGWKNTFYPAWIVAGLAFLGADIYVLGRGIGEW